MYLIISKNHTYTALLSMELCAITPLRLAYSMIVRLVYLNLQREGKHSTKKVKISVVKTCIMLEQMLLHGFICFYTDNYLVTN